MSKFPSNSNFYAFFEHENMPIPYIIDMALVTLKALQKLLEIDGTIKAGVKLGKHSQWVKQWHHKLPLKSDHDNWTLNNKNGWKHNKKPVAHM